jgi:O-acetylhomoserine/O-acetylserine sulfhydrylase-like pyridoxal-dependent enzyme
MDRICDNALKVAGFLQKHGKVGWVNYAGLPEHPDHALGCKNTLAVGRPASSVLG